MKTVSQYQEDIKSLMKKADDVAAKGRNENRDLTQTELSMQNEIMDTVEEYKSIVATMTRQERLAEALAAPGPTETRPGPQPRPAGAEKKDRFMSFGEQMSAVMRAGVPGGSIDPRLFRSSAASGMNETTPSEGGFLVQTDFSNELLKDVFETGILASRVRRIPISGKSNSLKINGIDETSRATGSRSGGIVGYWEDEAALKTASKPKFRQIQLNLKKLIGLCYATDELIDDTTALEGVIRDGFRDEFGFLLDDAIFNGTGSGQPLGFMNAGSLVSVTKETGQSAATV